MSTSQWRAGVDIGGTFTDLLLVDAESSRFRVGKVLTTASEPAVGVRAALEAELLGSELPPEHLGTVVHGTTLVTNAVVERKGASALFEALGSSEGEDICLNLAREYGDQADFCLHDEVITVGFAGCLPV